MNALFPQIVISKYQQGEVVGKFEAVTLFLDLSGFTKMTESLMSHGKEGAEILSSILNTVFTEIVSCIYKHGGFISSFAGDACVAIFPEEHPEVPLLAVLEIQKYFLQNPNHNTEFGVFTVSVKQGMSLGPVEWGIIESENILAYYFRGRAIDSCADSEHRCDLNQIIVDGILEKRLKREGFKLKTVLIDLDDTKKYVALESFEPIPQTITIPSVTIENVTDEVFQCFFPLLSNKGNIVPEFRNVASVFINFDELEKVDLLQEMVANALNQINSLGGYLSSVDFGDKGCVMLAVFGAPIAYEDNVFRACKFALELKNLLQDKIRIGITEGGAYCGYVGSPDRKAYTVLGDIVNLSARLMGLAEKGQILASEKLYNHIKRECLFEFRGEKTVKGKQEPVKLYELIEVMHFDDTNLHAGSFVGYKKELALLTEYTQPFIYGGFGGLTYVYGDMGVGKSRLLYEFTTPFLDRYELIVLQTANVAKKSLNPFITFFYEYFKMKQSMTLKEKRYALEKKLADFIEIEEKGINAQKNSGYVDEIIRVHSVIAALLGLRWDGSLYETIHPRNRFDNYVYAIRIFFQFITQIRPIILVIEDAIRIDEDSKRVLDFIIGDFKAEETNIIIFAACRYNDDNTKPKFLTKHIDMEKEIVLSPLSDEETKQLIEFKINGKVSPELTEFLIKKTEKNPFYIDQTCHYLLEHNLLSLKDDMFILINENVEVPDTISSLLIARIDRLSNKLQHLVQTASALGKEFKSDLLSKIIDFSNEDFMLLLKEGVEQNIWRETEEGSHNYYFTQALLAETAYEMQLSANQKKIHARIAFELTIYYENEDVYYSDIAAHYEKAGEQDKYIEYLEKAASYEHHHNKSVKAIEYYYKLISAIDSFGDKNLVYYGRIAEVYELQFKLNESIAVLEKAIASGQNYQAKMILESEFFSAEKLNLLTKTLISIKAYLGELYSKNKQITQAFKILKECIKEATDLGDAFILSKVSFNLGKIYLFLGRYDQAEVHLDRASIEHDSQSRLFEGLALYYMGILYKNKNKYNDAVKQLTLAEHVFITVNDQRYTLLPSYVIGTIEELHGNFEAALTHFKKYLKHSEEIRDIFGIVRSLNHLGLIDIQKGNYATALELFNKAIETLEEVNDPMLLSSVYSNLSILYYKTKEHDKYIKYAKEAFITLKDMKYFSLYSNILSYLVCEYAQQGKINQAIKAAYYVIKNIKDVGYDIQNGRVFLGLAMALVFRKDVLSPKSEYYLAQITQISNITINQDTLFKQAIALSRKTNFVSVLLPSLIEYAHFLITIAGNSKQATPLLIEAKDLIMSTGITSEFTRLLEVQKKIEPSESQPQS